MDIPLINFLFSVAFILIGSLAFHISALISGHNIYRDFPPQESALLSIVVGIVIFLLSPISFIILLSSNANYTNILIQILNFDVLFAFFGCAFGLGLIFGGLTILKLRWIVLNWFRNKYKMKFWIFSYELVWDNFLGTIKKRGEVFVQTHNTVIKGLLDFHSIRNEPKEIILELNEPKEIVHEVIDKSKCRILEKEDNIKILIPGLEIKSIMVPERSFRKHHESMNHISQAFYCLIIAIGLLFLFSSAYLTENYIQKLELENLESFYYISSQIFLLATVFFSVGSVWTAKNDFNSFRAFLVFCPFCIFVAPFILLLIVFLLIFINIQLSKLILTILFLLLIYHIIRYRQLKRINTTFEEIEKEFDNSMKFKLLRTVIQDCYILLSCNEKDKECLSDIEKVIIERYKSCEDRKMIKQNFIAKLNELKQNNRYLEREDFNIIFEFGNYIDGKK